MIPLEIQVQRSVEDFLVSLDLWPYDVFYMSDPKLLKISFIVKSEIEDLLDFLSYRDLADKSGIVLIWETKTIILSGINLRMFLSKIEKL
jgi:hypothetical protein